MQDLIQTFLNGYGGYASYLWYEVTHPSFHNYFYWLVLVSAFFFGLEIIKPWRKNQPMFRKDFWLDFFYMFFNFFLFSLVIYNAASDVIVDLFNDGIRGITGFDLQQSNPLRTFPLWAVLLIGFLVRDFVQWWVHRLLHRVEWLWQFHKVHHSVEEMGFAAHLRYHWMETVVYRSIEYIPLALLGIGLYDFFVIHIFTLAIGHYNHSNFHISGRVTGGIVGFLVGLAMIAGIAEIRLFEDTDWTIKSLGLLASVGFGWFILGPFMKKIFNSPEMHIWHHVHDLPEGRKYGINFGISLAIWDYIFGTAAIPHDGRDIKLGFPGDEKFPHTFIEQFFYGVK
ncbi:MAG: sterol desaturase family protein [Saprospiraceae bacterium]|nr:sterol desaturase family protein [Saprospiraceae bacterium]MBP6566604.1 sterol desaturase family protein [Saprospiraceae bacterium]